MPTSISVIGATFSEYLDTVNPPDLDTAAYYGLFGTDATTSLKNLAPGGVPGTLINTPTYTPGYATFGSYTRGIDTGVMFGGASYPFTYLGVFGRPASGSVSGSGLMGRWSATPTADKMDVIADTYSGSNNYALYTEAVAGQANLSGITPSMTNFNFVYGQSDGNVLKIGHVLTDGAGVVQHYSKSVNYVDPTPTGTRSLKIGALLYGSADVAFNASAAMAWGSILSTTQILAQYAWLRKFLAARAGGAAVTVN